MSRSLEEYAVRYAICPFYMNFGPRRSMIAGDLNDLGYPSLVDNLGNIICILKKEEGGKNVILSSHMDTVFWNPSEYRVDVEDIKQGVLTGTIDNSAGCAINTYLAKIIDPAQIEGINLYLVYTVLEEPVNKGLGEGAKYVLKSLKTLGVDKVDLCVAIDVCENADEKKAIAENFSSRFMYSLLDEKLKNSELHEGILVRDVSAADEASIYGANHSAFAFGPCTNDFNFDKMHTSECSTPFENLRYCADVLAYLLQDNDWIIEMPEKYKEWKKKEEERKAKMTKRSGNWKSKKRFASMATGGDENEE